MHRACSHHPRRRFALLVHLRAGLALLLALALAWGNLSALAVPNQAIAADVARTPVTSGHAHVAGADGCTQHDVSRPHHPAPDAGDHGAGCPCCPAHGGGCALACHAVSLPAVALELPAACCAPLARCDHALAPPSSARIPPLRPPIA